MEFSPSFIDKMLEEGNYLAAYLAIKESFSDKEKEIEYRGKCVTHILDELTVSERRRNREKVYYFRSLLLLIFEDVPVLARLYRRQLRTAKEVHTPLDFLKDLKELTDVAGNREELNERIEDTIEDIRDRIEDTTEGMKDGSTQDSLEGIVNLAGEGIKEGLKGFAAFLNNLSKTVKEEAEKRREEANIERHVEEVDNIEKKEGEQEGEDAVDDKE
jgi:hypothetical protein